MSVFVQRGRRMMMNDERVERLTENDVIHGFIVNIL